MALDRRKLACDTDSNPVNQRATKTACGHAPPMCVHAALPLLVKHINCSIMLTVARRQLIYLAACHCGISLKSKNATVGNNNVHCSSPKKGAACTHLLKPALEAKNRLSCHCRYSLLLPVKLS